MEHTFYITKSYYATKTIDTENIEETGKKLGEMIENGEIDPSSGKNCELNAYRICVDGEDLDYLFEEEYIVKAE